MADLFLREIERRFRETGGIEDEPAWLRARVRAGDVDHVPPVGARLLDAQREHHPVRVMLEVAGSGDRLASKQIAPCDVGEPALSPPMPA